MEKSAQTVIQSVDQVTPAWLTAVLTATDALTRGAVAACEVTTSQGNWSSNVQLRLRYTPGAQGALPTRLFLKMVNTDTGDDEFFGPSEVHYYTRDYVDVPDAPLIRCYHAAYSEAQQRYHLLLDDVSETHVLALDKSPTLAYGQAVAEGLAALHARWWGAVGLAAAGAPIHNAAHIQRFIDIAAPGAEHILRHCAADLQPHWSDAMRTLFARHPQTLMTRARDLEGFTLIHGDANETNILVPRVGDRPVYLIDRQPFDWSLTTWLAAYDLAYIIALDWDVATRRRLEEPVLRHYLHHLRARGVNAYSWQQLFDDYRHAVVMGVYIATEYCRGGINEPLRFVWLRKLQRALTACDDLACSELWA